MQTQTRHLLELAIAGVCQTLLLAFAWGFLGSVLHFEPITLPDYVSLLMHLEPSETTLVVTLIGTVLSVATGLCFTIAFKEALRHRMHQPISLIKLSGGVALARGAFMINFRHVWPSLLTLSMYGLTKLMVSSWSTLLTPTVVACNITAVGWELDLNSSSFESQLGQELVTNGYASPTADNAVEIIDTDGLLSGITTAQYAFGITGVLDFNGVLYNISTGGIVSVAPPWTGSSIPVQQTDTGLAFVGGLVQTNLSLDFPTNGKSHGHGFQTNYTLFQQGLTADVNCYQVSNPNVTITPTSVPVASTNGSVSYLTQWDFEMACSEGNPAQQQYVTREQQPNSTAPTTGVVSSLVCPYPVRQPNLVWNKFNVTSTGYARYSFLQSTVCEITPKLTTSQVVYSSQGILNTTVINSTLFGNNNGNLSAFLAAMVDFQSRNSQGLFANSIGDAVYSIYVSANMKTNNSSALNPSLLEELEQYWRGIVEFSGTYLRSGFSAYPISLPEEALSPVNGHITITTMGWTKRSATYLYTVLPVTFFAILTYWAIGYALWNMFGEQGNRPKFTTFDPSNPVHLIMVSSARDAKETDNLDENKLCGFENGGIEKNEELSVQLTDVHGDEKAANDEERADQTQSPTKDLKRFKLENVGTTSDAKSPATDTESSRSPKAVQSPTEEAQGDDEKK